MSLNRHAKRRDGNEAAIVAALRAAGATVYPMDKPVDLLVGYKGGNHLLEVKNPDALRGNKDKRTDDQKQFEATWLGGRIWYVYTPEDALRAIDAPVRT